MTAAAFSEGSGVMPAVDMFNGGVAVYNVLDPVKLDTYELPAEVPANIRPSRCQGRQERCKLR